MSLIARACVSNCPTPQCPACPSDQVCFFSSQTCDSCAQGYCAGGSAQSSAVPSAAPQSSNHSGAIAGGVVGGLLGIALVIGIVLWKFVYQPRARERQAILESMGLDGSSGDPNLTPSVDADDFFEKNRASRFEVYGPAGPASARMSSATMSTVNTRSSNIIPIAYIPGVTTRAAAGQQPPLEHMFSASDILGSEDARASIGASSYRGSAYIANDAVTAVQGRPNLIDLGASGPRVNSTLSARDSTISMQGAVQYASAQQAQRVSSARSIRIGKNAGVGLQNHMIVEEAGDEEEEQQNDNKVSGTTGRPPPTRLGTLPPSSSPQLRISQASGFDVPFMVDADLDSDDQTPRSRRAPSRHDNSRPVSRNSVASRISRMSRRTDAGNRESAEYIVEDLPPEAYLLATQGHLLDKDYDEGDDETHSSRDMNDTTLIDDSDSGTKKSEPRRASLLDDKDGRSSPFDDKYESK